MLVGDDAIGGPGTSGEYPGFGGRVGNARQVDSPGNCETALIGSFNPWVLGSNPSALTIDFASNRAKAVAL